MTVSTGDGKFRHIITMTAIKKLKNKESEQGQLKVQTKQISLHQCVHVDTIMKLLLYRVNPCASFIFISLINNYSLLKICFIYF